MILNQILFLTEQQEEFFAREIKQIDQINILMLEKEPLIQELNLLDEGFDSIYQKVKPDLLQRKDVYQQDIIKLQDLINELVTISIRIQTIEANNKIKVDIFLVNQRIQIKQLETNSMSVTSYAKNMM